MTLFKETEKWIGGKCYTLKAYAKIMRELKRKVEIEKAELELHTHGSELSADRRKKLQKIIQGPKPRSRFKRQRIQTLVDHADKSHIEARAKALGYSASEFCRLAALAMCRASDGDEQARNEFLSNFMKPSYLWR